VTKYFVDTVVNICKVTFVEGLRGGRGGSMNKKETFRNTKLVREEIKDMFP